MTAGARHPIAADDGSRTGSTTPDHAFACFRAVVLSPWSQVRSPPRDLRPLPRLLLSHVPHSNASPVPGFPSSCHLSLSQSSFSRQSDYPTEELGCVLSLRMSHYTYTYITRSAPRD